MRGFDPSLIPLNPDLSFEQILWQGGEIAVAGVDEAGRGALAGPVAAAAVILPADQKVSGLLPGVRDSKQMTPLERDIARERIQRFCIAWGVGFSSPGEIDQVGIVAATRLAAWRAIERLTPPPTHLLLDYLFLPELAIPQTALIKGDCRSLSIAAASIMAKTSRDALLAELDLTYPEYGFANHKGYGTRSHRDALQRLGPSPIHRLSFTLYR